MEVETIEDHSKTNEKIGIILQKLLEPDFKIQTDVQLNLFLTRLFGNDLKDEPLSKLKNRELNDQLIQWIIAATSAWEKGKVHPDPPLLSFALRLTGHLCTDEHIFVKLNCRNVFESLVGIAQINLTKDLNVINGIVSLLCSFLKHKSGVQWAIASIYGTDLINLGLTADTTLTRKNTCQFVTKLLEKAISFNRNFGVNLVVNLLKPAKDVLLCLQVTNNGQDSQTQDAELLQSLRPSLEVLSNVITSLLKSFNQKVLQLFLEERTPETIEQILPYSQNEDISYELLKIQFVFLFFKMCVKLYGLKTMAHDSVSLQNIKIMFDAIKSEMDKNNVRCVIKICGFAHELYSSLAPRVPLYVKEEQSIEFEDQLVLFQLFPLVVTFVTLIREQVNPDKMFFQDDLRKHFGMRCFKLADCRALEFCFGWRENLLQKTDLGEDATFGLHYLSKAKNLLNKERTGRTVFPMLVYCLKDTLEFITTVGGTDWVKRNTNSVGALVDTIVDLVESFDLTWNDSIETIRVMDLAIDFLNYPNWTELMIIIKGFKLLNTAISKYMSPDLVLLIYSIKDSKVCQVGRLLYAKCHDITWEIRDSALEVVYTLALNANTRFAALTDVLLATKLPQLVANMALEDDEYYVRTTAIRCLQEFIDMPDIRNVLLSADTFLGDLLSVFGSETEGIIRKEAAVLVHRIYKHQGFPDAMLPRLYDVMSYAAIGDSYWEVRCNALDFWFETWTVHLANQGMIDKQFPSHTFSKEHKKIILLNEAEVRKRIIKVLTQLSNTGCLHVLKCAVMDDSNVEVSKKAADAFRKLLDFFKMYKVSSENIDQVESPRSLNTHSCQMYEPMSPANSTTLTACSPPSSPQVSSENIDQVESSRSLNTHSYQMYEPMSPANSTTLSACSPPSSPQYFDLDDPFSAPYSPSLNPILSCNLNSQDMNYSPQVSHDADSVLQHESRVQAKATPIARHDPHLYNNMEYEATSRMNRCSDIVDVDMLDAGNEISLKNKFIEVTSNTTKSKTKTYLSASEFLKFVHKEVETLIARKRQSLSGLDDFDSLLDNILKEFNSHRC